MKLLKIEDSQGLFLSEKDVYVSLDKITKEHLLKLVDLALKDDATFDPYSEEKLKNQAHQIIYKSIYGKLKALNEEKEKFIDESKRLFLKEYEKYSQEPT